MSCVEAQMCPCFCASRGVHSARFSQDNEIDIANNQSHTHTKICHTSLEFFNSVAAHDRRFFITLETEVWKEADLLPAYQRASEKKTGNKHHYIKKGETQATGKPGGVN